MNLVIENVAIGMGASSAVVGHDRLERARGLLLCAPPGAVATVAHHHHVAGADLTGEALEGGEDGITGRLFVAEEIDPVRGEPEALHQHAPELQGVVNATLELLGVQQVGVPVDADEQCVLLPRRDRGAHWASTFLPPILVSFVSVVPPSLLRGGAGASGKSGSLSIMMRSFLDVGGFCPPVQSAVDPTNLELFRRSVFQFQSPWRVKPAQ